MRQPKDLRKESIRTLTNCVCNNRKMVEFKMFVGTYRLFEDYVKDQVLPFYQVTGEQINKLSEAWYNEKDDNE